MLTQSWTSYFGLSRSVTEVDRVEIPLWSWSRELCPGQLLVRGCALAHSRLYEVKILQEALLTKYIQLVVSVEYEGEQRRLQHSYAF